MQKKTTVYRYMYTIYFIYQHLFHSILLNLILFAIIVFYRLNDYQVIVVIQQYEKKKLKRRNRITLIMITVKKSFKLSSINGNTKLND